MDELRQVRELAEDAPGPDPERKTRARAELLHLAREEQTAPTSPTEVEAERRATWVDRLASAGRRWLRPAPAAGLATAVVVGLVGAGVLLSGPADDQPLQLDDPETAAPDATDPGAEDPPVADPDPTDPGTEDAETDEPAPDGSTVELAASCEGPDGQVTVDYPDGWYTPEDGEPGACRFFGEDEFDVDEAIGGAPISTLQIVIEPAELDELLGDELGLEEQERDELDLAGRRTVRQRSESTGEAMLPDGVLTERYLVDLDGDTLIITTHADDAETLDERRPVLEAMARNIEADGA